MDQLEEDPATRWRVGEIEWRRHRKYEEYLEIIEDTLSRTDREGCPWTPVAAMDRRFAAVKICGTLIQALEQRIRNSGRSEKDLVDLREKTASTSIEVPTSTLDKISIPKDWNPDKYEKELEHLGNRLHELHYETYKKKIPVLILFEGWDAAGKGGNIKRITGALDPRGYEVHPIASPEPHEKARHYLWRFWTILPKDGHIAIFDRTWYGRVMVERLEGFCSENDWKRAYNEMNEFEKELSDWGAVIIKFWVQIDKDTQLERFNDRQNNPEKRWKITDEDWRNREKWDAYVLAVNEMLEKTSTKDAPWIVVEGNSKWYARIKVLETVADAMEKKIKEVEKNRKR